MANSRKRENWDHTSQVLAMIHNTSLRTQKALKPSDIHPFGQKNREPDEPVEINNELGFAIMREAWCKE
jgi:hypothetical protein